MKFSFVIIAYNEEANIVACVNSVLNQRDVGNNYEIVVVDDGSHDQTASLVTEHAKSHNKVRLIGDGKNRGRGYARHAGVLASTGKFVAMIDGDIVLPKNWLATCLKHIERNEAVSGIPVPDGDVAFIFNKFKLKPKIVITSATITGSNGLYKREVFDKINFNQALRNSEDIEFNHQMDAAGYRGSSIGNLIVAHNESISFKQSICWLYQSGIAATYQLKKYKVFRLPDLAFFGFVAVSVLSIAAYITMNLNAYALLLIIVLYLLISSALHMHSKFELVRSPFLSLAAIFVNFSLLGAYYIGRLAGIAT